MSVLKYKESIPQQLPNGLERRVVHLTDLMTAIIDFTNGPMKQPHPPHFHPHEQISYVAKGELYVFLGEEKHHVQEGDIFSVPSGVPHTVQTLSREARLIDSFSPIREDFLTNRIKK